MIDQVKGTRNLYGKDIDNYLHIRDKFLNCYASYGYKFVELPNIEHKDLFTKSIGENSEIVTKQMYEFEDKAGRSLVLRPEGTASVVRYHNEFHKDQSNKYSYFGKMYRYENPQKNRYREFHQAGAELIGTLDNYSDVQLIKSSFRFLNSLELNFKLKINTIGSVDERKEYVSVLKKYFDKNKKDLINKIKFYKNNDNARIKLAKSGHYKYHKFMSNKLISKYIMSCVNLDITKKLFWHNIN